MKIDAARRSTELAVCLIAAGVAAAYILGNYVGAAQIDETRGYVSSDMTIAADLNANFNWLIACITFAPFLISASIMVATGLLIRATPRPDATRPVKVGDWAEPVRA